MYTGMLKWIMLLSTWNKHTLQHCKSPLYQYKIQITKRECWLYSLQALVTWAAVTSLKPGQAWVPWMDCLGTEEGGKDMSINEPFPMDLTCLFPSALAHNLQIQAGPPAVKLHLLHPKDVEPLGWKSFEKPPGFHVSRWRVSHLQLPSLGSPHLWWKHPPQSGVAGTGMCPGDRGKERRRNGTQALGVSSGTAAAAKSLQSCPTLCNPIDGSPPGSPVPGILQTRTLECHFLLQCMKVKSESEVTQSCLTLSDPMDCSPPGSSVRGLFQARVLEWAAIASPSSGTCHSNWQSRNRTFPKALVPPVTRVGAQRHAAALWPFPITITETFAHGHLIGTRPAGYK